MLISEKTAMTSTALTVALAAILWIFSFGLHWGNFWYKISFSAVSLALISLFLREPEEKKINISWMDFVYGAGSALVLYLIFYTGKAVSTSLFPFAGGQISSIYAKGAGTSMGLIFSLLIFITGPSEEIYWRGFLQNRLSRNMGAWPGFLLSTFCYTAVHIVSMNFMLIGAAAVAGAFWGLMYMKLGRLTPVIISHSIWSSVIFAISPIR